MTLEVNINLKEKFKIYMVNEEDTYKVYLRNNNCKFFYSFNTKKSATRFMDKVEKSIGLIRNISSVKDEVVISLKCDEDTLQFCYKGTSITLSYRAEVEIALEEEVQ